MISFDWKVAVSTGSSMGIIGSSTEVSSNLPMLAIYSLQFSSIPNTPTVQFRHLYGPA